MIEHNHEPIVDEALFTYAHKRISAFDLNGKRQRPERVTRHSKVEALLKKVLKDPDGTPIYANSANRIYTCVEQQGRLIMQAKFAVSITAIDIVFLEKFFERIQSMNSVQFSDWEDKIEQKRLAKEDKEKLIQTGIREVHLQMARINQLLTRTDLEKPLPASLVEALVKQYDGLEAKKEELAQELLRQAEEENEDDMILYEMRTLIPRIVELWKFLPFEKRLRFVSALVHEVILNRVSPGWLTMEIHWKLHDWETDFAYIRRGWCGSHWVPEEDLLLRALYPIADAADILQAFPTRGGERSYNGHQS